MLLKPVVNITIEQRGEGRSKKLFFDFVNNWEWTDGWRSLTSGGSITFPKNIYVRDVNTKSLFPLFGVNKSIGEIFKKGDRVNLESYYIFWDENTNEKQTPKETIFEGYVTKVNAKVPVELTVEDSMYLLKQTPIKNQSFKTGTSLEDILKEALIGTGLTVNFLTTTKLVFDNGLLNAENETVAQFLAKLKKDCFLNSYFRGTELNIGSLVYVEATAKTKTFEFQNNIISSDLVYSRKDDLVLSAVASNHIEVQTGQTTKDGQAKTKSTRIEVLVTLKGDKVISKSIKAGEQADPNTDGERRTFTYPFAKTEAELIQLAEIDLKKYYYDGFKGKFTTFGTPFVKFGDNAKIVNEILPEQNGTYKIKEVQYSGGVGGLRQIIELDYKILL